MPLLAHLHRLMNREPLTAEAARAAMSIVLRGEATTPQIAAFLVALRMKGETPDEIFGLAQAMRDSMIRVETGITGEPVLDTCGTGGDGRNTLNVSTLAALVAAGAGVKVAKHGNRSISSRCGSADLLERLGVRIDLTPQQMALAVREVGFAFLFAPALHPAMKHAAAARAELKTRTAFNLLGPLTNPASATVQLIGAPTPQAAELMAVALSNLGLPRGYVVHGDGGLDEISTTGPSTLLGLLHGAIDHRTVGPEEFGVRRATQDELSGGDPDSHVRIAREVLSGAAGPHRDVVLVNAAVALMAAGKAADYVAGMTLAAQSVDSGAALDVLTRYAAFTQRWRAV